MPIVINQIVKIVRWPTLYCLCLRLWIHNDIWMAGLRNISLPVVVCYTAEHLRGRLLEDLGSHTSSGKSCRRSSQKHDVLGTSRWNKCRNGWNGKNCIKEGWKSKRWSGRERRTRTRTRTFSKRTRPCWESARINGSVQGTNQRCKNHDLHHSLFHPLLDADVLQRPVQEINGKADQ